MLPVTWAAGPELCEGRAVSLSPSPVPAPGRGISVTVPLRRTSAPWDEGPALTASLNESPAYRPGLADGHVMSEALGGGTPACGFCRDSVHPITATSPPSHPGSRPHAVARPHALSASGGGGGWLARTPPGRRQTFLSCLTQQDLQTPRRSGCARSLKLRTPVGRPCDKTHVFRLVPGTGALW